MKFNGALITEQGVTFAIVVVKPSAVFNNNTIVETQKAFQKFFPLGTPIILMVQNSQGIPTYYGRRDIVNFLAKVHPSRIPWKTYTVN